MENADCLWMSFFWFIALQSWVCSNRLLCACLNTVLPFFIKWHVVLLRCSRKIISLIHLSSNNYGERIVNWIEYARALRAAFCCQSKVDSCLKNVERGSFFEKRNLPLNCYLVNRDAKLSCDEGLPARLFSHPLSPSLFMVKFCFCVLIVNL